VISRAGEIDFFTLKPSLRMEMGPVAGAVNRNCYESQQSQFQLTEEFWLGDSVKRPPGGPFPLFPNHAELPTFGRIAVDFHRAA
jgi:hypothetical protein